MGIDLTGWFIGVMAWCVGIGIAIGFALMGLWHLAAWALSHIHWS